MLVTYIFSNKVAVLKQKQCINLKYILDNLNNWIITTYQSSELMVLAHFNGHTMVKTFDKIS